MSCSCKYLLLPFFLYLYFKWAATAVDPALPASTHPGWRPVGCCDGPAEAVNAARWGHGAKQSMAVLRTVPGQSCDTLQATQPSLTIHALDVE